MRAAQGYYSRRPNRPDRIAQGVRGAKRDSGVRPMLTRGQFFESTSLRYPSPGADPIITAIATRQPRRQGGGGGFESAVHRRHALREPGGGGGGIRETWTVPQPRHVLCTVGTRSKAPAQHDHVGSSTVMIDARPRREVPRSAPDDAASRRLCGARGNRDGSSWSRCARDNRASPDARGSFDAADLPQ